MPVIIFSPYAAYAAVFSGGIELRTFPAESWNRSGNIECEES